MCKLFDEKGFLHMSGHRGQQMAREICKIGSAMHTVGFADGALNGKRAAQRHRKQELQIFVEFFVTP